jgi:hypothetical protein
MTIAATVSFFVVILKVNLLTGVVGLAYLLCIGNSCYFNRSNNEMARCNQYAIG